MYVVLGASGRAGGETARALIENGEAVRVVVRRPERGQAWKALGAEVAIADIEDADAVAAALEGAAGAFLINPPPLDGDPYARATLIGQALASAARQARLPKAVVLSSIGAGHAIGTGIIATLNRMESLWGDATAETVFLRPGYFVETWSEVAEPAVMQGVLPSFLAPDRKIPMVSTVDVGRTAAQLLRESWAGRRVVELSGPEDWSASDVAAAFSEALDRTVALAFVPRNERAAALADAGVPTEVADALLGMYDGLDSGRISREEGVEQRRGSVTLSAAIRRVAAAVEAGAG